MIDSFCKSVYCLSFVDNRLPIQGAASIGIPAEIISSEVERTKNNLQQYFWDLYEDNAQVTVSAYCLSLHLYLLLKSPILWYFLFAAAERFESIYRRWPGSSVPEDLVNPFLLN